MRQLLEQIWYQNQWHPIRLLLAPLSWLYRLIWSLKQGFYRWRPAEALPVPVLVVGNITVGGTGKTPILIRLCQQLQQLGWKPAVISRGYGSQAPAYPFLVTPESAARQAGDEPLLIAKRCQVPVVIDADRNRAAHYLLSQHPDCDLILSDDGLQHLALARDLEIIVIDGERRLGNGQLLPSGPCREPARTADWTLIRQGRAGPGQWPIEMATGALSSLSGTQCCALNTFSGQQVHAVAGIGYPSRFFQLLRAAGLIVIEHAYPDHYRYQETDLQFEPPLPLVMTEKDAVKCAGFSLSQAWYLPIQALLPAQLIAQVDRALTHIVESKHG